MANVNGNANANTLNGTNNNDVIDGRAGADTMSGRRGNDRYIVDNAGDVVIELSAEGTDTVEASVSYTLSANVEDLVLSGENAISGTGNALNNNISGNLSDNLLSGGDGNDVLTGDVEPPDGGGGGGGEDDEDDDDDDDDDDCDDDDDDDDDDDCGCGGGGPTGAGNDTLLGGSGNDTLFGNGGNDSLDGGTQADRMEGGTGNDIYVTDDIGDVLVEAANAGTDTVKAALNYTLLTNFENLELIGAALTGTGNTVANLITGNALGNTLNGMAGNDTINGGAGNDTLDGGVGIDSLAGGAGDDTYLLNGDGDVVVENAGEGRDTIQTGQSWSLAAYPQIENVTLTGTGNFSATGNALDNVLTGNSGNNLLDGVSGNDTLIGGAGDDTYLIDGIGDVIVEAAGQGIDTILVAASWNLSASPNVENLTLLGSGDFSATGNALNNVLTGNTGNNLFDGGLGVDTLVGGGGNDIYLINGDGDVIVETVNQGVDTVVSSVDHTLTDNVENLQLVGGAIVGNGNALDNVIVGNDLGNVLNGAAGNDILIGGIGRDALIGGDGNDSLDGGTGPDTMTGGAGDDVYIVDHSEDVIVEAADQGIDTVLVASTFTIDPASQVENVSLLGSANISATGNALRNVLVGNSGDNVLSGLGANDTLLGADGNDTLLGGMNGDDLEGGEGNDSLDGGTGNDDLEGGNGNDTLFGGNGDDDMAGGAGADRFAFNGNNTDNDEIEDFEAGLDHIALDNFASIGGPGALGAQFFHAGSGATAVAQTADQHIIFDQATGNLYYDADGNGAAAQELFANVAFASGSTLNANDFQVI